MSEGIFAGRTALVTGAGRGIGRAIACRLAQDGARVAVNYQRNAGAAQHTLDLIRNSGGQAITVAADVAEPKAVAAMVATVREQLGPIDFLVNNAGIHENVSHAELTFASWKRIMAVNVDGPFLTTWAVKDEMIARRFGRIVNVSSLAGLVMKKDMIHYATSKAAVIGFTRNCAEAFAPYNIRVNCLAPGLIDTDISRAADPKLVQQLIAVTPLGRMAQPEEMAAIVRFLLSEESSFMTGQTLTACGGRL
jgi:NAD(P)-dependent dehydrogenase (short-subunit alcohol dehydrogenase family)